MSTLKTGWIKKKIDEEIEKIFAISHAKSSYYNYGRKETVYDKLTDLAAMLGNSVMIKDIAIPASGWESADESGYMYVDVAEDSIKDTMIPIVSILPESIETAKECGLSATCKTTDGGIRFLAKNVPKAEINVSLILLNKSPDSEGAGTGSTGPGGGTGSSGYVLPVASADRLGGVKIGNGVDVEEDGTISVDGIEALNDMMATDDDIENTLNSIFGPE